MQTIAIDAGTLAYEDQGQGAPLLLVHGFPLDHCMWREQLAGLSHRYRVIAPDLRGFGRSSAADAEAIAMEEFADDLASLLDALKIDEPVVLAGLSMGGYVAWQFWRRHADRLRGLILCDTRAVPDAPEAKQNRYELAAKVLAEGPHVAADAMVEKLFASSTRQRQPELVESMRQVMLAAPPDGIAAALRGMAERSDATPWLSDITVPALVIVGREDVISTADEMRGIAQALPQARFVEVPEAGHLAPLENPTIVNEAILDFAGNLPGAA